MTEDEAEQLQDERDRLEEENDLLKRIVEFYEDGPAFGYLLDWVTPQMLEVLEDPDHYSDKNENFQRLTSMGLIHLVAQGHMEMVVPTRRGGLVLDALKARASGRLVEET